MMRDERFFSDPETFNPDRFADKVEAAGTDNAQAMAAFNPDDPSSIVFGIGRR